MSILNALPAAGATVNPTRFMNRQTPLSDMTLDQFELIHGPNPTKKAIPERPMGPPRQLDEIRAAARSAPTRSSGPHVSPHDEREAASRSFDEPYRPSPTAPVGARPSGRRPVARIVRAVEETPGAAPGKPMNEPCGDLMDLEFEIEGGDLVLLTLECEVLGDHPNQPHMARTPGHLQRDPGREQDVFVGWADAL